jgi:nucleotide-binding universal stress UspA family protein
MAFRDILLAALTYPDATPDRALRSGVALAKRLGGDLTVAAVRVDIPELHNVLANALAGVDQMVLSEEARSAATARHELLTVAMAAEAAGVTFTPKPLVARLYEDAEAVCRVARTRDLCLLPVGPAVVEDRGLAEAVLFGSGRPIIIYPEEVEVTPGEGFDTVAIAWDRSARAARAVADALPILKAARSVRILVVTDEKPQAASGIATDLARHLKAHGVAASIDEAAADGRRIGPILTDYVLTRQSDLLVMGGFQHTRVRQFVLGGATDSMLDAPPCPVLLSH